MARRRLLVLLALAAAIAATIAVLTSSGNHSSHSRAQTKAAGRRHVAQTPPRKVHGPHDRPVPILMYHVISSPQPGAPYPGLYTPEPVFAAQMQALARH